MFKSKTQLIREVRQSINLQAISKDYTGSIYKGELEQEQKMLVGLLRPMLKIMVSHPLSCDLTPEGGDASGNKLACA